MISRRFVWLTIGLVALCSVRISSGQEANDLAKAAQNPISDLISVPLQLQLMFPK